MFLKKPDSKYFRFAGHKASVKITEVCHCSLKSAIGNIKKWARLCSSKALFTKTYRLTSQPLFYTVPICCGLILFPSSGLRQNEFALCLITTWVMCCTITCDVVCTKTSAKEPIKQMTPSHHSSHFTRQPSMALLRLVASGHTIPSLLRWAGTTSQISHFRLPSSAHHSVPSGAKGQTMLTFYNDMDDFFFFNPRPFQPFRTSSLFECVQC